MRSHWIDNKSVPSAASDEIPVVNPATEETIDTIPRGSKVDVDHAVVAARRAQPGWAALAPSDRRNALRKVVARLREHQEEIARLLTLENGKPLAQSRGEVATAIDVSVSFTEMLPHLRSGNQGASEGDLIFQHRQARGVAGCIIPWNFPVAVGLENVMPNLGVGNTVVWKPSEKTPLSSQFIAEHCFGELPPGVANLVLGDGPHCGEHLVAHEGVDLIVFVGSERTGRRIGEICGRTLKKVILELGGKDPLIVDDTVDIRKAAALCAEATYANAGQICTSTERIYVQKKVFDPFRDALVDISSRMRLGDGLEADSQMGPLVDDLQLGKVSDQVEDAIRRGAEVHSGGARLNRKGYFFPPTVLSGITNEMTLMSEETFGPVAPLIPFGDFDEAISLANEGRYGLAAIVCTTSAPRAIEAIQKLDAGMVKINTMRGKAPGATSEPFKASGLGHGYGVEFLYEITRQKSVHWRAMPK
jgi:acyl-CoA reductase-like NAD-dependent aldehyde dehydrogenase